MRNLVMAAALLALLVFATATGDVWHSHGGASGRHCQVCHLSHQVADSAGHGQRMAALEPAGSLPALHDSRGAQVFFVSQFSSRAPPL